MNVINMKAKKEKSLDFGSSFVNIIKTNFGILLGLVILSVLLTMFTDKFATMTNLFNIIRQITINLYLACGMTFVILLAGIDLSVGSVIAIAGCVSAGMITWNGFPVYVGIAIGLGCGLIVGMINGLIISRTNIPAFIVTLAMMNIGRGFARIYTGAKTIAVLDDSYTFWGMGTILGVPIQLFTIIAVIAVSSFILNKTQLGRHIFAVGGNSQAAEYSGINVKKITFFVFLYSGILASLAGILTVGRTFTATMILGDGAEMDAISAVVLGGTSMSGGRGSISGTVIGVIVIGVLKNGMNLLGIDSSWQYVVQGIVILIAVYIDYIKQNGSDGSLFKNLLAKVKK
ncbi:ribose transport system permease protein [Anaerobium acetethylicum]|uniref:Ribose transport system permease protein n=2 Tax=Anaerobium acetethylicum TaxID=1619234 RepID=A0A1D3TWJ8_9FIRM|nr:ribose transport system permease protein [Anaerobium acetethylicum]